MPDKILVVGNRNYADPVKDLGKVTEDIDNLLLRPEEFILVLFTGGADVSPSLYGDVNGETTRMCHSDIGRDMYEKAIYEYAKSKKIRIIGICRGLQFINVMEGGKLIHHLNGHEYKNHDFECLKDDRIRKINSLHHQMVMPSEKGIIVGWSTTQLSEVYHGDEDKLVDWKGPEVEAVIYPDAKACGVQWHPEMMHEHSSGRLFFTNMVYSLLNLSMDSFVHIYTGKSKSIEAT